MDTMRNEWDRAAEAEQPSMQEAESAEFDSNLAECSVVLIEVGRDFSVLYRQHRRFYLVETDFGDASNWCGNSIVISLGDPEEVSEASVVEWFHENDRSAADFAAIITEIDHEESRREWARTVKMFGKETLFGDERAP